MLSRKQLNPQRNRHWTSAAILALLLMTTGCNGEEASSQPEQTTAAPIGDFNFIENAPVATTAASGGSGVVVAPEDGGTVGAGGMVSVPEATTGTGNGDEIPTVPEEGTTPEQVVPEVTNDYVDLASNYSMRIGQRVYISTPQSLFEKTCDLETFLNNFREVRTLETDDTYTNEALMEKTYQMGTCLFVDDSRIYMEGRGMGFMCKNTGGTLSKAKKPSMKTFNIGKMELETGNSLNASYETLGDLIVEEETDDYYRSVYKIADLEGMEEFIDARAMLIFDKHSYSLSTVIVYKNSYCTDATFDLDVIAESFRYQTNTPDNLAVISLGD